jgi:DNA-binding NarL/FixJ family response regulator
VSEPGAIRLLLVDDHPVLTEGLAALIHQHPGMRVVAQARDAAAALAAFERHRPDVTLVDLLLPDMNGVDLVAHVTARHPGARFLVLTMHGGAEDIHRAVRVGCRGYLLKNAHGRELLRAIEEVHRGGRYFPHLVSERLEQRAGSPALTPREVDVLRLVAAGKRNRDIADALQVSHATVRTHVASILQKLGVESRTQATLAAIELGFVHLDR